MSKKFAAVSAIAAAGAYMIKNKETPASAAKKLSKRVKPNQEGHADYDNGVALTPPMGWSSWNTFASRINEDLIYDTAKALKETGLLDAGYKYVNIDDCWQAAVRNEKGEMVPDPVTFPSGIRALADKVNALGVKLGIYSSNGTLTCQDLPASYGHELTDARTFAKWGVEYFKYDFCHRVYTSRIAPMLEKISLSGGSIEGQKLYLARDAELEGDAKVMKAGSLETGEYITGLSYGLGAATFTVDAPEDGTYAVTFYMRRRSQLAKHLELDVNAEKHYVIDVPGSEFIHATGKHHIYIDLKKGENKLKFYNPVGSLMDSSAIQYRNMGKYLKQAAEEYAEETGNPVKPICFSICEWGFNMPWKWGKSAGNLWRTTPDIKAIWPSILAIYEVNVNLWKYAGPGGWNDPDMLEVGNGNLTYEENKAHFSLWCMMASPLILGNDIRRFILPDGSVDKDNEILKMVTNKKLIAIDQDELGAQCRRISHSPAGDILVKPLKDGSAAVCFFNKTNDHRLFTLPMKELTEKTFVELKYAEEYEAENLWDDTTIKVDYALADTVPPHGVCVYKIKNI
ncbi:MAG: alpha-galactosidase [Clostridia bacterium]|nr:alpha-galactosidase [Clostridia bacterium]